MRVLILIGVLAGCAAPPPEPPPPTIPARLEVCPDAKPAPLPPPAPRTVDQLIKWATEVLVARDQTAAALAECKRRLAERNRIT